MLATPLVTYCCSELKKLIFANSARETEQTRVSDGGNTHAVTARSVCALGNLFVLNSL